MATSYQQTDTVSATAVAACSGLTLISSPVARTAEAGGTAGASSTSASITASATDAGAIMWDITPAAGLTWGAGNYTVRLNNTTANSNITWVSCFICRINSAGTNQATIASSTAVNTSLGTTGVKSVTLSGSAQTPAAGDRIYVVLGFANSATMGSSVGYHSDQLIDTPLTAGVTTPSGQLQGLPTFPPPRRYPARARLGAGAAAAAGQSTPQPHIAGQRPGGLIARRIARQVARAATGNNVSPADGVAGIAFPNGARPNGLVARRPAQQYSRARTGRGLAAAGVTGPANAPPAVVPVAARQVPAVPRRYPPRVVFRGLAAPPRQPLLLPRPPPTAVAIRPPTQRPRGYTRFTPLKTVNAAPAAPAAQPYQLPPVAQRRVVPSAVWAGSPPPAGAAMGTPYKVAAGGTLSGTTTLAVTVTASTSPGDTIAVWVTSNVNNFAVTAVSDSKGNPYTAAAAQATNVNLTGQWWIATGATASLTAGTDTITLTCTGTTSAKTLHAFACSGIAASPVDQAPTPATGTSTAPSITSGALAQPAEWCLAGSANGNGGGSPVWGTPFSAGLTDTQHSGTTQWGSAASITVSSTAALTASETITSSAWDISLVTLKAASGGAGTPGQPAAVWRAQSGSGGRWGGTTVTTTNAAAAAVAAVPAPAQLPRFPRRATARAVVAFRPVRTVNAPPVAAAPQPPRLPRRTAARAVVLFRPVRTVNAPPANPAGSIQPRPTVGLPRRYPARAWWQSSTIARTTNPPLGAAQATLPAITQTSAVLARARIGSGALAAAGVSGPVPPVGVAGRAQPRATVSVPRRVAVRGLWQRILGAANAHGGNGAQPGTGLVKRRAAARAFIAFHPVRTVNNTIIPPGTVQPKPVVARRAAARAVVLFRPVRTTNATLTTAPVTGGLVARRHPKQVSRSRPGVGIGGSGVDAAARAAQPVTGGLVRRRGAARAVTQFRPVRTVNATPAAAPVTGGLIKRRTAARGVVLFRPVRTVNAPAPGGTIPPKPVVARRVAARGLWRGNTGQPRVPSGVTGGLVKRRAAARSVVAFRPVRTVNTPPPAFTIATLTAQTAARAVTATTAGPDPGAYATFYTAAYAPGGFTAPPPSTATGSTGLSAATAAAAATASDKPTGGPGG